VTPLVLKTRQGTGPNPLPRPSIITVNARCLVGAHARLSGTAGTTTCLAKTATATLVSGSTYTVKLIVGTPLLSARAGCFTFLGCLLRSAPPHNDSSAVH